MDRNLDYAHIYKTLNMGVRRGFFKKATHSGSTGDFALLAKTLAAQGCPDLAGTFLLGEAQCESSNNNSLAEAASLFTAAQYFTQAEDKLDSVNAVSYGENADCATMCLLRAAKIYENSELFTLAANVYIYLCDIFMRHRRWSETIPFLKRALEILSRDTLSSLQVFRRLVTCQLNLHDWPGALNTCLRMQTLIVSPATPGGRSPTLEVCNNYWITAEVLRVFLILLTCPSQKLNVDSGQGYYLDRYLLSDDDTPSNASFPHLDENLFLHLQTLVLAYRSGDLVELESACRLIQSHLELDQRELLCPLVNELTNPFGGAL